MQDLIELHILNHRVITGELIILLKPGCLSVINQLHSSILGQYYIMVAANLCLALLRLLMFAVQIQWILTNPNSLGLFRLMKISDQWKPLLVLALVA